MGEVVICVLVEHHSHENFNTSCWFLTTRATTRFCGFCGFCGLRAVMARIPGYFFSRPPPLRFRRRLDLRSPDHPVSSHPLSCYARSSAPSLSYACLVCLLVCPRFSHPIPPRRRAAAPCVISLKFPAISLGFPRTFSPTSPCALRRDHRGDRMPHQSAKPRPHTQKRRSSSTPPTPTHTHTRSPRNPRGRTPAETPRREPRAPPCPTPRSLIPPHSPCRSSYQSRPCRGSGTTRPPPGPTSAPATPSPRRPAWGPSPP